MAEKEPNAQLHDAMRVARMSSKSLARAVGEMAASRGQDINPDHTSVSRWLSGMQPREQTARLIAEVLGRRSGRELRPVDIGFSESTATAPDLGLRYDDSAASTVEVVGALWRADLGAVRVVVESATHDQAWADAALGWLVRADGDPLPRAVHGSRRVGPDDVVAIRATTDLFGELDGRFGGGHARRALIQYLDSDVAALLKGHYSESVGKALHSAVAEATLLAAWSSYDAGIHGLAQRYFVQALRLAQAASDPLLGGSILDAMSHQATFLGRHRDAARMARAARTGTQGSASATLTAHFYAMEARALAAGGDSTGAQRALSESVRVFERRQPGSDPDWISYFDDAELSAEFSHCFRDIGRAADAVLYAERSLVTAGASIRSDFFVTMVLAAGHLAMGEVEAACNAASRALGFGSGVKSARCAEYLRDFRAGLAPYSMTTTIRSFTEEHDAHPLWVASGQAPR